MIVLIITHKHVKGGSTFRVKLAALTKERFLIDKVSGVVLATAGSDEIPCDIVGIGLDR